MKWLNDNKEWIFSGVGVLVLGWIWALFQRKSEKPQPTKIQKSGKNSINIQGDDVKITGGIKKDENHAR